MNGSQGANGVPKGNGWRRSAAWMLALATILFGCSTQPTAPELQEDLSARTETARIATAAQLRAPSGADMAGLDEYVRGQAEVEDSLIAQHARVRGTAVSFLDGRPVILALTTAADGHLPSRIRGRNVAEFVVGDVRAQAYYCGTSTGRSDECSAGTLGAIVTDGVRQYWLSNWHVFVDSQGRAGDPVVSPGRYDVSCGTSTTVGSVVRYVAPRFDGTANQLDCAIAKIQSGISVSALEAAGTRTFLPSATVRAASVGLPVKKVGRSTGFTTGQVTAINATLSVNYGSLGYAKFSGATLFSPMSNNGDSGSLICTQSGNNPVSLLFAGSTTVSVGCPIANVFQAMGAHIAN